jgi:chitodextrinase
MLNRRARSRSRAAVVVALAVAVLMLRTGMWSTAQAQGTVYYVNPTGSDSNSGTTIDRPFKTIQKALTVAQPGATINLAAGKYVEAVSTQRAGTAAAPITIKGPETGKNVGDRYKAVLYGLGGRVFSISHSHYVLDGFTIDGQERIARTEYPASLSQARSFKDNVQSRAVDSKLLYVGANNDSRDITGVKISNMFLSGAGGECVRMRNRATNNLVVNSMIQWCGMFGKGVEPEQYKYHNGEGVYIGTSPKSTTQPLYANDTSSGNVVRDSTIRTFGSECFNVKENAHHNVIENSECSDNDEPLASYRGSNIEFRGHHNLIRNTRVSNSRSWNVKLVSDSASYNIGGNSIELSTFSGGTEAAIHNEQPTTDSSFCGNTFTGSIPASNGTSIGDPRKPCAAADTVAPAVPGGLTGQAASPTSVSLRWNASTDNVGTTGYLVLRNNVQIGTATGTSYTDSGVTPGTTYSYTVRARDAAGNTSAPSTAVSVSTPAAPTAQVITVEAESGTVTSPMTKRTDVAGAQGGMHVTQLSGSGTGRVTLTVAVPVAGRYALALRVVAPNSSSDSFTYSVDNGSTTDWHLGTRTSWTWVTGPTLTLTAGNHTIVVNKRENGARLDAIRLTPVP